MQTSDVTKKEMENQEEGGVKIKYLQPHSISLKRHCVFLRFLLGKLLGILLDTKTGHSCISCTLPPPLLCLLLLSSFHNPDTCPNSLDKTCIFRFSSK
eukprot:m.110844 g.110844  ORF g.110844 m.110844 type:complete len:98 (-) comp22742_c1_seq1:712-1005(-)